MVTSHSGIFPPLVKRMIDGLCGACKAYSDKVVVDFKMDGNGETARKNTSRLVQLAKTTDATQVSFPVVGPKTGSSGRSGSFIPIILSPSSAFITRKPILHRQAQFVIGQSLVETLPLVAFTIVVLFLGAILIWAVVSILADHQHFQLKTKVKSIKKSNNTENETCRRAIKNILDWHMHSPILDISRVT